MEAIIISGMPAAGKTTVAKILAKNLGVKTMGGGEVLKELAKELGYKPDNKEDWWDTNEGIEFSERRDKDPHFDKKVDDFMLRLIEEGDIILTSYTMPWLSKHGFKVWLSASEDVRAKRMSKRDDIAKEESMHIEEVRNKENFELYKRLYGIHFGNDLTPFHMIVDTNNETPASIAKKIEAGFHYMKRENPNPQ